MKIKTWGIQLSLAAIVCSYTLAGFAQETPAAAGTATVNVTGAVPGLINYSGVLKDVNGKALTGITGVTFLLYKDEQGGAPVWIETQNVTPTKSGQYTVTLGASKIDGSLALSFSSGDAKWLGVQIEGQQEQPRVLLVAVPYALKAGDAETIGGLPASAFMLANGTKGASRSAAAATSTSASAKTSAPPPVNPAVTGKGVLDFIPMWDSASDIVDSVMFQKSSQIGINTTAPAATLDVNGKGDVRDTLTLFPKSTDNTLAVSGTPFKIDSTGKVTFITGQTFPGTGTLTGITTAAGSGLSGGGTTGTLSLKIPALGVTNAMLASSKVTIPVTAPLTGGGAVSLGGTATALALKPCATSQVLVSNGTTWSCAAVTSGTITGVTTAAGSGLQGGGTSGTLNLSVASAGITNTMLQHSSLTLTPGSGLTGAGAMSLGGSYSLNIDATKIPLLASANTFTATQKFTGNLGINVTNTTSDGIDVSSSSGIAVYGLSNSSTGVDGYSNGFDGGVFEANSTGAYGSRSDTFADAAFNTGAAGWEYGSSQENIGVWGYAGSGIGVGSYSEAFGASSQGTVCCGGFYPIGVWADTSGNTSNGNPGIGALTTVDNGWSIVSYNNSSEPTAWIENEETSSGSDPVVDIVGGNFGGFCSFDVSGNLSCNGSITPVVPVAGGARKVAMNSIGSTEHWFEDAGSAHLSNGEAVVNIESLFGETVSTGVDYHVFLTPNGDCKGLYIAQKSPTSFVVRELGGGTSTIAFDYRIMAKRKGFENVRMADKTASFTPHGPTKRPAGARGPNPDDYRKAHLKKAEQLAKVVKPVSIKK